MGKLTKALKQKTDDDAHVRLLRTHERELGTLKARLLQSEQRRKQAEQDLWTVEKRQDIFESFGTPKGVDLRYVPRKASGQATAIIVLSDWHVEETVDPESVDGFNEYNLEIAERRIKKTFENSLVLLESARHLSPIKDLVVAVLGDMISGYIHEELMENNSLSPTEAVLFVEGLLIGGLDMLWKQAGVKSITIPTCTGNHGRTTPKMRIATDYANSYEWLAYKHLEKHYRQSNPAIQWKVGEGYHNWLEVQGHPIRFHHGHAIKYNGGIGGPSISLRKSQASWDKARAATGDICGHLHTHIRDGKCIVNNSLIGYGPFSLFVKAEPSPPSQTFVVYDRKRTRPVIVQEIWCD